MESQAVKSISLYTLKNRIKNKTIRVRPDYQRYEVWKRPQKQLLIDSILKGIPIPEAFLEMKHDENDKQKFSVLDGQQRFLTIYQFMNDGFRLGRDVVIDGVDLSGLYYSKLPEEIKEKFDAYNLGYVAVSGTQEEIREMFRRFQNGTSLKKVEIRHSTGGAVVDFIEEMLKHPFLTNSCGCSEGTNARMTYNYYIEQMLIFELHGITTVKDKEVTQLYKDYYETIPEETTDKIITVLDYLYKSFGDFENKSLFSKTGIQGLYLVAREYYFKDEEYENAEKFAEWFVYFENMRAYDKSLPEEDQNSMFIKYNNFVNVGTSSKESLEGRRDILLESWKEYLQKNLASESLEPTQESWMEQEQLQE